MLKLQQEWVIRTTHRKALAAKYLSNHLSDILNTVIKVVNYIKARPLNSRLFKLLCEKMGSDINLLLHTKVRWLSRGKVLKSIRVERRNKCIS